MDFLTNLNEQEITFFACRKRYFNSFSGTLSGNINRLEFYFIIYPLAFCMGSLGAVWGTLLLHSGD